MKSLENLKGVGPKTLEHLNKLKIHNIKDLLEYYPYRYDFFYPQDYKSATEVSKSIVGRISSNIGLSFIKKNLNRLSFKFMTNNALINVVIFNRAFLKQHLKCGQVITLIGKYNPKNNTFNASGIKLKEINKLEIEPKYHVVKEVKNSFLVKIIQEVLVEDIDIDDYIPFYLTKTYNFTSKEEALKIIHQPQDIKSLKKARLRLIYEELFIFMFKINYLKYKNNNSKTFLKRKEHNKELWQFIKSLKFELTNDQKQAIQDIKEDFLDSKRMNRLILGDVGSGKSIVSFMAMYLNFLDGYQSVLMAPTEILARQHYYSLLEIFKDYNLNICLLTGKCKKKERSLILEDIKNQKIDFVIATHAVLSEDVSFNNLGLVITDEQHRFGVNQRSNLVNKGQMPDVLYLSATPIPRTYALTLYGDMQTSIIKTKPQGRREVKTILKKPEELKDVLYHILEELKKGHQIYVVAPSIEENDDPLLTDVNSLVRKFKLAFKDHVNIGVIHGKLKQEQKEKVMEDFLNKKYSILISTTVIEVGVDVANATMMVIFNSERFGLATLHQLRGRVGRNDLDSYCYLISAKNTLRLQILEESNDGFYISQKDFELRKEGDLFGDRQSGEVSFKLANIKTDYKILLQAQKDSLKYLEDNINNNFLGNQKYLKIIKEIDFLK